LCARWEDRAMSCKCIGCRYPLTHVSAGHKCGSCGGYGHGQLECGNVVLQEETQGSYRDRMPPEAQCTFEGCHFPHSHGLEAHHCDSCGARGGVGCCRARGGSTTTLRCPFCRVDVASVQPPTQPLPTPLPECAVCMENTTLVVLEPCRHAVACAECIRKCGRASA